MRREQLAEFGLDRFWLGEERKEVTAQRAVVEPDGEGAGDRRPEDGAVDERRSKRQPSEGVGPASGDQAFRAGESKSGGCAWVKRRQLTLPRRLPERSGECRSQRAIEPHRVEERGHGTIGCRCGEAKGTKCGIDDYRGFAAHVVGRVEERVNEHGLAETVDGNNRRWAVGSPKADWRRDRVD